MKVGSRNARLSAAVMAALCAASPLYADNLIWNPNQSTTGGTDGQGNWDSTTTNWYDSTTNSGPVSFNADPSAPDSVTFGTVAAVSGNALPGYFVTLSNPLTVNNVTFSSSQTSSTTNTTYDLSDQGDGNETLTLQGNVYKTATNGNPYVSLSSNIALSAGTHTFVIADTGGDGAPELTFYNGFSGSGGITLDNSTASEGGEYGSVAFVADSTNTGPTNIVDGRIELDSQAGLGTGAINIGLKGVLSIGGSGIKPNTGGGTYAHLTVSNPITITHNTYTGTDYGDYSDALISNNNGRAGDVTTFTQPITIDSTDARIGTYTSQVVLSSGFVQGPTVGAGNAVADLDGDYAGFITLNGDSTAFGAAGNTIAIGGGVEVNVNSEAELGGATSKLALNGGEIHPTGALATSAFMTNFGSHVVLNNAYSTGVDLDAGTTFNVNGLSGGGVGERGLGTMNFSGTNVFTGAPFFDGGIINFTAGSSTTQVGLGLRSPVVNIAGALSVHGGTVSIGNATNGTVEANGSLGPDMATVNIVSGGSLIQTTGEDFRVSDAASTSGTINLSGTGILTTDGVTLVGRSTGGTGIINQSGGTLTINRSGNFGFDLADGRGGQTPTGTYNLSGGTFADPAGEIYVGEGGGTGGTWNQTGGTATFGTWFVVGRESASGTVNISGGTFTKTGTKGADDAGNISIGDTHGSVPDTFSVTNGGVVTENDGEMWVGNGGGIATLNVGSSTPANPAADAASSLTVNNWFAVGRAGTGTLNIADGSVTQATAQYFDVGGDGNGGNGTVNLTGGSLTAYQTIVGENGNAVGVINVSGGNASLSTSGNPVYLSRNNTATGTINLNSGTLTAPGFIADDQGGTGKALINFNGGTLIAGAANTNFIGGKVTSVVSTGGAIINPNGHADTINSLLSHDSTLSGADGGLTVANASTSTPGGTITLAGVETYTGPTTVTGSANLAIASGASISTTTLNASTAIANAGTITESGGGSIYSIAGTGTLNISGGTLNLTNPTLQNLSTQAAINLTATGKLNIGAGGIQIATGNYATLVTEYKAGTLFSTSQQASPASHTIGIVDNGTNTIAEYALYGDSNLDGTVNITDFNALAENFDSSSATFAQGDFNYDGTVNITDFNLLAENYDQSLGAVSGAVAAADWAPLIAFAAAHNDLTEFQQVTGVPEPTTFTMAVLGGGSLLMRRRRKAASRV